MSINQASPSQDKKYMRRLSFKGQAVSQKQWGSLRYAESWRTRFGGCACKVLQRNFVFRGWFFLGLQPWRATVIIVIFESGDEPLAK
eukprot:4663855-Karenia_brevis.AAC.1